MSSGSDDCSDFSEGKIEERMDKIYKELKEKNLFTRSFDGFLRCPYCLGRKKQAYRYKDLLQHATGVGNSNKRLKETARHRALAKFLQLDFIEKPVPSITPLFPISAPSSKRFKKDTQEVRFVWPWMGIVVNIQAKGKDGKHFATTSKLKELFARFNAVKAYPLWDYKGFQGTAILEFNKGWSGYHSANSFERSFLVDHHGKKEWVEFKGHGSSMYGWMAREDDYNSADRCVREHLQKHGDLRTVTELEDEEKQKTNILVDKLKQKIDLKNKDLESSQMRLKEVMYVLEQTMASLKEKESDMTRLMDQYNEGWSTTALFVILGNASHVRLFILDIFAILLPLYAPFYAKSHGYGNIVPHQHHSSTVRHPASSHQATDIPSSIFAELPLVSGTGGKKVKVYVHS
ncbi:hypothetical protein EJ110_NYTH53200 [Nymphaea thermarum]|nr:hypothetical protein EJ110_NYTH53200 [Nymphaea thermarum]